MDNGEPIEGRTNLSLDLADPIQRALLLVHGILVSKGHDYSQDADPASGFKSAADHMDVMSYQIVEMHILNKLTRLKSLRDRNRDPLHESV
jgi:hypothetical protein